MARSGFGAGSPVHRTLPSLAAPRTPTRSPATPSHLGSRPAPLRRRRPSGAGAASRRGIGRPSPVRRRKSSRGGQNAWTARYQTRVPGCKLRGHAYRPRPCRASRVSQSPTGATATNPDLGMIAMPVAPRAIGTRPAPRSMSAWPGDSSRCRGGVVTPVSPAARRTCPARRDAQARRQRLGCPRTGGPRGCVPSATRAAACPRCRMAGRRGRWR